MDVLEKQGLGLRGIVAEPGGGGPRAGPILFNVARLSRLLRAVGGPPPVRTPARTLTSVLKKKHRGHKCVWGGAVLFSGARFRSVIGGVSLLDERTTVGGGWMMGSEVALAECHRWKD